MNRSWENRIGTAATILAIPVLMLALWNGTTSARAKAVDILSSRRNRVLADSIITTYSGGAVLGNAAASRTLIEFLDYECPACQSADQVLRTALARNRNVRILALHYPLHEIHPHATLAAQAAVCAERIGIFEAYHHALFAASGALPEDTLLALASRLGGTAKTGLSFKSCLRSPETARIVSAQRQIGSRLGVGGTPTFVNGEGKRLGLGAVAALVDSQR